MVIRLRLCCGATESVSERWAPERRAAAGGLWDCTAAPPSAAVRIADAMGPQGERRLGWGIKPF